jgi:CheY-like chemotaxis protein
MIQAENPRYDLVFMDHMMPGMDGIEATRIIRRWEEEQKQARIPIVALTANAITGNIEKFLAAGFDGFISKPIDIVQLDEALNKYVRDKQNPVEEGTREQGLGTRDRNLKSSDASGLYPDSSNNTPHSLRTTPHSPFPIPGVDTEMGIKMTGGTMPLYRDVLALFCRDAEERLSLLEKYSEEDGLPGFVTQVHALKGASASIGAAEVPALAAQLETAGKAGDLMFIQGNLHGFTERLAELINNISTALRKNAAAQTPSQETAYSPIPRPLLIGLAVALDAKKVRDIDRFLNELIHQSVDPKTKKIVDKISDDVLMAELSRAAEAVRSLYNRLPEKQKAATAQSNQEV